MMMHAKKGYGIEKKQQSMKQPMKKPTTKAQEQ